MIDQIYKTKNIDINQLKNDSPLDQWFITMVMKRENELDILDISRMLRQDLFPDITIPLVWKILRENPFEGEMYEGQLLELLIRYLIKNPKKKNKEDYFALKNQIRLKQSEYFKDDLEGKADYEKLVNKLEVLFDR
jgi:hypothetical protein